MAGSWWRTGSLRPSQPAAGACDDPSPRPSCAARTYETYEASSRCSPDACGEGAMNRAPTGDDPSGAQFIAPSSGAARRQLGVVLTPAEVQDEGLDRVLDNIQHAGATAISP